MMPTITEQETTAYAHCRDARCSGYHQEEVPAVREETSFTCKDLNGPNSPNDVFSSIVERSIVGFRFADPDQAPCAGCGVPREVTGTQRPSYRNESGFDPNFLIGGPGFDPGVVNTPADEKMAALEAQVAKLTALLTVEEDD